MRARSERTSGGLVFRSQVVLGLGGVAVAAAAVIAAGDSVHRSPGGVHRVVIAGQDFTYPSVNVAAALLLGLATLGAAVLWRLVRDGWREMRGYRRFVRTIHVLRRLPGDPGDPGVNVIADATPQAFCAGYFRPAVYVSQGTLALLSGDELDAVVRHEEHHRAARDPLRFAVARTLSRALFFLPALRPLGDRYLELAEQRADHAAVAATGERAPLASALLAFEAAVPPGAAGISPERVDALLGRPLPARLPRALILVSAVALCVLVMVVWRASRAASADATFNLPVLSAQPCMLVLALVPLLVCAGAASLRRRPPAPHE